MISSRFLKTRMSEETEDTSLSEEEFYSIKEYIYSKSGIFIADNKKEFLESRVRRRVQENNFNSFKDYYYFLKYSTNDTEFRNLMDAVTINETKFFRDLPLLETFEKQVLPDVINTKMKKNETTLRILSAGCSTGEEPYTLAIILNENKGALGKINFKITAGDISEQVISSAKRGIYKETQLRTTPESYKKKYFTTDNGEDYRVSAIIKMAIDFNYMNLADFNALKRLGGFDIIFCRNVMIYFDNDFKKQLVRTYYDILKDDGYFFVGHSESLFSINSDFKAKSMTGATVYKKERRL